MSKKKYSGGFEEYESKLRRVMERFGVKQFNYDWNRSECFIEFTYHNQFYRFEHSLEKATAHKQRINCVSDLFAQLVMSLEDIARIQETFKKINSIKKLNYKQACALRTVIDEIL